MPESPRSSPPREDPRRVEDRGDDDILRLGEASLGGAAQDAAVATAPALVPSVDASKTEWPKEFLPIDYDLAQDASFGRSTIEAYSRTFRYWQVEALLNHAADLTTRCVRERAEYDDLKTRWMDASLGILEFDKLNAIHEKETQAGWYTLNYRQSAAERSATQSFLTRTDAARKLIADWSSVADDRGVSVATDVASVALEARRAARAAAVQPSATTPPPNFNVDGEGGFTQAGGVSRDQFLSQLGAQQAARASKASQVSFEAQREALSASADQATRQLDARGYRAQWDREDIAFRRERSNVSILMNELKRVAMETPGGPYNYFERTRPIMSRFAGDMREVYARVLAANRGVQAVWGLSLQPMPVLEGRAGSPYSVLDACLLWVRIAINAVNSLAQLDQFHVRTYSLKRLVGAQEWDRVVEGARRDPSAPVEFQFDFSPTLVDGHRAVRLRGVSLATIGLPEDALLSAVVRPPKAAARRYPNDTSASPIRSVAQSDVPSMVSGRVRAHRSPIPEDVIGTSTSFNLSPLSDMSASRSERCWTVSVGRDSPTGHDVLQLGDLMLSLQLASHSFD